MIQQHNMNFGGQLFRGDVNRCDEWSGWSALHHAAANDHMNCVSFLTNFGANLWTLDLDSRSAMEVAAAHGRQQIVQYLDDQMASCMLLNPKDVARKKSKAVAKMERLRKQKNLHLAKRYKDEKNIDRESNLAKAPASVVQPSENQRSGGLTRGLEHLEQKFKDTLKSVGLSIDNNVSQNVHHRAAEINIPTYSDYAGTVKVQQGQRKHTSKINNVFYGKSVRTNSSALKSRQGGIIDGGFSKDLVPEATGLFDRPGFGSMAFRGGPLCPSLLHMDQENASDDLSSSKDFPNQSTPWFEDSVSTEDDSSSSQCYLQEFLKYINLSEYTVLFHRENITLSSLVHQPENSMSTIDLPSAHRKLLESGIQKLKTGEIQIHGVLPYMDRDGGDDFVVKL